MKFVRKFWVQPFLGYPDIMALDQGPQFSSPIEASFLSKHGIEAQHTEVESQVALSVNERYHAFLLAVYAKRHDDNFQFDKNHTISLAVKAENHTVGPCRLVLTIQYLLLDPCRGSP